MIANEPLELSRRYFDGWRRRDAGAVLATLTPDGTYEDPLTGGPLRGDALRGYMERLWSAFPDLDFELGQVHATGDRQVHAEWTMLGHQDGPFDGLPPTGRAVRLRGLDVIDTGAGGIRGVLGYFDSAAVPRQLGLDVLVQPGRIGPFEFGTSTLVRRERPVQPGVVAVTELVAARDDCVATIRESVRDIVREQSRNADFLSFTAAVAGRRMVTVSGWTSADAMSSALRGGAHAQAMQRFWRDGIAEGGFTSVYARSRFGPYWRRCGACGAMSPIEGERGACRECGAPVEALA